MKDGLGGDNIIRFPDRNSTDQVDQGEETKLVDVHYSTDLHWNNSRGKEVAITQEVIDFPFDNLVDKIGPVNIHHFADVVPIPATIFTLPDSQFVPKIKVKFLNPQEIETFKRIVGEILLKNGYSVGRGRKISQINVFRDFNTNTYLLSAVITYRKRIHITLARSQFQELRSHL